MLGSVACTREMHIQNFDCSENCLSGCIYIYMNQYIFIYREIFSKLGTYLSLVQVDLLKIRNQSFYMVLVLS